jgi:uncharacterized membrane protein
MSAFGGNADIARRSPCPIRKAPLASRVILSIRCSFVSHRILRCRVRLRLGLLATSNAAWATAAIWLLRAGLIMAALAAVVGLADVLGEPRIRALNDVWWHAGGNVTVVLIELYSFFARYSEGTSAIVPKGLVLSYFVVHWLEGLGMVYRYRVGVADADEGPAAARDSTRRAA